MNKYNTLLGQLLALVGRPGFEKLVRDSQADKHCKGFTAWQQFVTMSYAQIASPNGLRSLENSLNSNRTSLYHLGIRRDLRRSTISYANNNRSCRLFESLFYSILGTLNPGERRKFRRDFHAVDATEISLNMDDFPRAEFRSTKGGVKINMKYDINNSMPAHLLITNAREHESNSLMDMRLGRSDTVVFDRGYCNYQAFGDLCRQNINFVTRLKENAQYEVVETRQARSSLITLDQTVRFTGRRTGRKCPCPLRIIRAVDEKTGNEIALLTNIFGLTPAYVAKLYRARWSIEIFFKTMKQNLRIKKFYGQTENAVKSQIWIALIVYLLYLKPCKTSGGAVKNFTHFICELSVCLFHRKDLFEWLSHSPPARPARSCHLQLELAL